MRAVTGVEYTEHISNSQVQLRRLNEGPVYLFCDTLEGWKLRGLLRCKKSVFATVFLRSEQQRFGRFFCNSVIFSWQIFLQ